MSEKQRSRKVSVFALAKESASVQAEISAEDVMVLQPDRSRDQATKFLREHTDLLGKEMVAAGLLVLVSLIGRNKDVN